VAFAPSTLRLKSLLSPPAPVMVHVKALRVPPSSGCVPLESSSTSPPSDDWLGKTWRRLGEAITTVD
jgi:hypothetical protein